MGRIQWCLVACVVLLAVIGEVTDARGQIEWNYGPKDRRKRQITINGGNTRGPLAGFLGQLARPSDKEENKPTPLGFIGGIIGGAINEFSTHAGNLAEHLAGQNPFFNGAWNNQGGISFPPELQGITWGNHIEGKALRIPYNKFASGFQSGRAYYLGFGNPDFAYQSCTTPNRKNGRCRFVQHCARPEIILSLDTLLSYACPIGSNYMGVCCPEGTEEPAPVTPPVPKPTPATTPAPTTAPTTAPTPAPTSAPTTSSSKRGCGALSKQLTRIVGGQPADKGEWPWMAALLRDSDDQYCGGVLVTDQHILSAAHCVDNFKASDITIRLGEYDFEAPSNSRRDFDVERIYMHERYNRKTYENDIALLKLKKATTFNNDIWPICLPPPNVKLEGKSAYVTGWGTTSYSGQSSKVLLEVFLPIWKNSDCKRAYTQTITDKQVCAGYRQGGKDSCQGDSGGPLMYQMSTGRWAVVGVVSWGIRCAEKDKPGVYSRVDSYSDWIKDKVLA